MKKINNKESSSKNVVLTILLGVFIVLSAMQSFQISSLSDKIEEGNVKIGASSSKTIASSNSGSSGGSVPSNIADLPQMVGGC